MTAADRWTGAGAAPGTAIAASSRVDRPLPAAAGPIDPDQVERAFRAVAGDLERLAERVRAQGRRAAADIVAVGALIATDPDLVEAARAAAGAADPLRAIHDAVEGYATVLESLPDETLRERAADVRQVGRRVLEQITQTGTRPDGGPPDSGPPDSGPPSGPPDSGPPSGAPDSGPPNGPPSGPPSGAPGGGVPGTFVLVARELGPADLLEHLGQGLVAAVGVRGGANSHAAIIARSVGIPLVTGVHPRILDLPDNTLLLVDADAGLVVADPPAAEVARVEDLAASAGRRRAALRAERDRPAVTADGQAFELLCNVASDTEVRAGRDSGAAGIGLLRTELPFLHADRWPAEADHRRALRPILAEASGSPVTVRLLDFANDKIPPFLHGRTAGLRALLGEPAALTAQLRAVVDLGRAVQLQIMVPMVTDADELRLVRSAVDAVVAESGAAPAPVGAMVETVAAVEAIGELCAAADFLSIGTNDLAAEVLGLDRTDPQGRPELTADPRVLGPVARVVSTAGAAGVPVSVCGDAAAHPTTLPLLLGTGVRRFSVSCARVDETRYRLHRLDTRDCAAVVADALRLPGADPVAALVRERIAVALP